MDIFSTVMCLLSVLGCCVAEAPADSPTPSWTTWKCSVPAIQPVSGPTLGRTLILPNTPSSGPTLPRASVPANTPASGATVASVSVPANAPGQGNLGRSVWRASFRVNRAASGPTVRRASVTANAPVLCPTSPTPQGTTPSKETTVLNNSLAEPPASVSAISVETPASSTRADSRASANSIQKIVIFGAALIATAACVL